MDDKFSAICETHCLKNLTNYLTGCNESFYVDCLMYPKQIFRESILIPISVVLLVLLITGVVGNLTVILVIIRHSNMRTATDFYLLNLAASDVLLLLFGLPQELWMYWQLYPYGMDQFMCKLRTFVTETTSYVSVLTIVTFSLERYLAICHPLRAVSAAASALRRVGIVVACIWTICIGCAMPFTLQFDIQYLVEYPPGSNIFSEKSAICSPKEPLSPFLEGFLKISSIVFFVFPMILLLIVYLKIVYCLRTKQSEGLINENSIHCHKRNLRNKNTVTVLVAVVIAFFVCWAPFHYQRLVAMTIKEKDTQHWIFVGTGLLYFLSATVNPILYNVMSLRYRGALEEVCKGLKCCSNRVNKKDWSIKTETRDSGNDATVSAEVETKLFVDISLDDIK